MRDLPVLGDRKPQDPGRPWWRTRFGRVRVLAARRQRRHGVGGGCAGDGWRRRGCRVGRLGAMLWRSCRFAVPGNEQGPLTAVRSRSAGCGVADTLALVSGSTGGGVRRGVLRRGHRAGEGASAKAALFPVSLRSLPRCPAAPAAADGGGGGSRYWSGTLVEFTADVTRATMTINTFTALLASGVLYILGLFAVAVSCGAQKSKGLWSTRSRVHRRPVHRRGRKVSLVVRTSRERDGARLATARALHQVAKSEEAPQLGRARL